MKVLLLGLALGAPPVLFAEGAATPGDVVGGLGGVAGLSAVGVITWMMKQHKDELRETREEFMRREQARDQMFRDTIKEVVSEFKTALRGQQEDQNRVLREMRNENQRNTERQFELSKEVVQSMELVNQSLLAMSHRLEALEEGGPFHQKPHYPKPGQNPLNDPPKPPRR